jgi:hypothetical protein
VLLDQCKASDGEAALDTEDVSEGVVEAVATPVAEGEAEER